MISTHENSQDYRTKNNTSIPSPLKEKLTSPREQIKGLFPLQITKECYAFFSPVWKSINSRTKIRFSNDLEHFFICDEDFVNFFQNVEGMTSLLDLNINAIKYIYDRIQTSKNKK